MVLGYMKAGGTHVVTPADCDWWMFLAADGQRYSVSSPLGSLSQVCSRSWFKSEFAVAFPRDRRNTAGVRIMFWFDDTIPVDAGEDLGLVVEKNPNRVEDVSRFGVRTDSLGMITSRRKNPACLIDRASNLW